MSTRIPIKEAKELATKYRAPVVVIFALTDDGNHIALTTYGMTKKLCRHAASLADQITAKIMAGEIAPVQEEPLHLPDEPTQYEGKSSVPFPT